MARPWCRPLAHHGRRPAAGRRLDAGEIEFIEETRGRSRDHRLPQDRLRLSRRRRRARYLRSWYDSGEVLPVCTWLTGEYGLKDVYLGVPAELGRDGVREVVELPLEEIGELADLRRAALIIDARQNEAEETIVSATKRATGPSR